MQIYHKLVRDRIPQVIASTGKKYSTRILDHQEYLNELKKKSYEELQEYINAKNDENAIEELADLLEIIRALAKCHGANFEVLEKVRKEKLEKRRGFEERIFLIEVEDD